MPVTAFCEYQDGSKVPTWFARLAIEGDTRPLFFFAGITRTWTGTRGTKDEPVEGTHRLYSLLTTEPNAIVKLVHSKDMPVILTEPAELELWLEGAPEEALKLQRPAEGGILDHLDGAARRQGLTVGHEQSHDELTARATFGPSPLFDGSRVLILPGLPHGPTQVSHKP